MIQIPFDVYFQDPLVAKENPELAFDEEWYVTTPSRINSTR